MSYYLYSAIDKAGSRVTLRVEAITMVEARRKLEADGFSSITFHTDGTHHRVDFSAEDELWARRAGSVWNRVIYSFLCAWILWVPLVIWTIWRVWKSPPYNWPFWLGIGLDVCFILFFIFDVLPSALYAYLQEVALWHDWQAVRRTIKFIRFVSRFYKTKIPAHELDRRLSHALAAEGSVDEAINLIVSLEKNPHFRRPVYLNTIASIYELAGHYDLMAETQRKVTAEPDAKPTAWLDLAYRLSRRMADMTEAKAALERVRDAEVSDLARPYRLLCEGVVSVNEGDYTSARRQLQEMLRLAEPIMGSFGMRCWVAEAQCYLGIALANLGEYEFASQVFQSGVPLMKAQNEIELLKRCQEAMINWPEPESSQSQE